MFNSPQEVGDAIAKAGFDVVLHATNHTMDKKYKGVQNTLDFWKKYPEIEVLGIHESAADQAKIPVIEKNGIETVSYTHLDVYKRQQLASSAARISLLLGSVLSIS